MDWKRQCAAVIPCFNEAERIGMVVSQVQRHLPTVIVVDDGSTDPTAEKARAAGAQVIRLPNNLGKGAALQTGWQRAQELGFSWVLMLDGDGQHTADDIPRFFACGGKKGSALVVGNRMGDCRAMPWLRRKANQWMSKRMSQMTGMVLPDSQCGFRLAHLKTLSGLNLCANRFEIESAVLFAFCRAGRKVEFLPIRTLYGSSGSKINPLTDTFRWLKWRFLNSRPPPAGDLQSASIAEPS
jgi:glycosyltransferase involved in cell wall biosynthesis